MAVSDQIIQVINTLCEKVGIVIDWTSDNVIPYIETLCQKLIAYEIATSITWMVIMMSLSVASVVATKKCAPVFKKGLDAEKDTLDMGWGVGTTFAIIGLVIFNLVSICVISTQVVDIIKCAVFPEMYVFEYVSKLMAK